MADMDDLLEIIDVFAFVLDFVYESRVPYSYLSKSADGTLSSSGY